MKLLPNFIKEKNVIVFDFDGVLADSVEVKTEAFAEIYREYGEEIVRLVVEHHRRNGGMSRFEKFNHYHSAFLQKELDQQLMSDLVTRFSALVVDKVVGSREIPGATNFLKYCNEIGKSCYINSATPTDEIRLIVERRRMSSLFEGVYGSPQTKKENLNRVLMNAGCVTSQIVFFGDAASDMKAAESKNISFIGVGEMILPLLEQSESSCFHINDFIQLVH